jgi:hypothetical protein
MLTMQTLSPPFTNCVLGIRARHLPKLLKLIITNTKPINIFLRLPRIIKKEIKHTVLMLA